MTFPLELDADQLSRQLCTDACLDLRREPGEEGPRSGHRNSILSQVLGTERVSFNFSHVDTAALTQSHVWGMVSRKPGTMECFSTGTHNGWLLRVVLCSVLSMWCLNWTFSWPLKGNNFKRKNFKSAKSQIMAQDRKSKGFVGFILKYKSLNASKQQPPENVKFNVWG